MIPEELIVRIGVEMREFVAEQKQAWLSEARTEIAALKAMLSDAIATIPAGPKGDQGDPGRASTEPGPRGDKGEPGTVDPEVLAAAVAAEVTMAVGSIDRESLRGPAGEKGEPGVSIKGDPGEKGESGEGKRGKTGEKGDRGDPGRDGVATRDELHELVKVNVAEVIMAAMPAAIEKYGKTLPKIEWHGVWQEGTEYTRGDVATWGGSLWHCDVELSTEKPDGPSKHWRLMVKRGRDGRDGAR